jgi:hypothetical protein
MTDRTLTAVVYFEAVQSKVYLVRGNKVMLDRDLADLYQVKAIALRQQVKQNHESFPEDFMFQLNEKEVSIMLSQNVIPSKKSLGGDFIEKSANVIPIALSVIKLAGTMLSLKGVIYLYFII